ncbi:hypothetical protein GCM10010299_11950 [Streptomyces tanashiensis]|nr:hypothetical protein GCM10010299_11950 [Streptomyces tanashiensis]
MSPAPSPHVPERPSDPALLRRVALSGLLASVLIGVLPTYATIGVAAPVLLVLFRVVRGVAIGGEWGGATLMVVEHADPRRRGLWSGVMRRGSPPLAVLAVVRGLATALAVRHTAETRGRDLSAEDPAAPAAQQPRTRPASRGAEA